MTTANMSTALVAARAEDSARRHDRVVRALDEMSTAGAEITVSAVARAARVHRSFIHRHPELHAAVAAAQREPAVLAPDSAVSVASLRTELANMHAQNTRLARHITLLETRLSEAGRAAGPPPRRAHRERPVRRPWPWSGAPPAWR